MAAGLDELMPFGLRELRKVVAPMVRIILQTYVETGRFSKDWNDANVCPLFKIDDKSIALNYRPISLACILYKHSLGTYSSMHQVLSPTWTPKTSFATWLQSEEIMRDADGNNTGGGHVSKCRSGATD